jgi:glycerol uptake facilitator-like aquaporin
VARRGALSRRVVAEALATAFLLAGVVGSGIMGERLSGGNGAIALLANSLATGALLAVLIAAFGPLSGAHLNPVVTLARAATDTIAGIRPGDVPAFVAAQLAGGAAAVALWCALAPDESS